MDIAAVLSTSVPSYFVIGPLAVLFLLLVIFVGKKDSTASPVSVATPAQTPPASPSPVQAVSQSVSSVAALGAVTASVVPPVQEVPVQAPVAPPVPASIPPISSWKPLDPAPVASEPVGQSESDMQVHAALQEGITPVEQVPAPTPAVNQASTAAAAPVVETPAQTPVETQVTQESVSGVVTENAPSSQPAPQVAA